MKETVNVSTEDLFFFDQEKLQTIADRTVISRGLEDHKENRVMEIDQDQDLLWGRVEGADPDVPNDVTIRLDEDGISFACDCDDDNESGVCRHIVAVLCRYGDQYGETDKLLTAADSAIKDRIKRGRSEVEVESLSGEHWFGSWRASSLGGTSHFSRSYRVTVRSLRRRANFCTCPDFAGNQLGTCKHIEAVLHKVQKHPEYAQFREQSAPFPYVYLAWGVEDAPQLMVHRPLDMGDDLQNVLDVFLLAAAAGRAGLDTPVTAQDAGVWIYGEALAKGLLSQEEAALIMRAVSLSQSPSVPEPLLADLRMDVEAFVDQA